MTIELRRWLSILALAFSSLAHAQSPANGNTTAKSAQSASTATAVFAGGCFWCTEADFEKLPGVIAAESGYAGGKTVNPDYASVSRGETGHAEAVKVTYDTTKLKYSDLLDYFWKHVDPTVKDRQFCDVGTQYRTAIFYQNDEQKEQALASKTAILAKGKLPQVYTQIEPTGTFYPAEEYHQDYYKKNPVRYKLYRLNCGRDARLEQVWSGK
jgi:peptide-methionine (S)-S-oxide reductase